MPTVRCADLPLPSPMSCQSTVSCDSWATSSTVFSSLSVQTMDDMETDHGCGPCSTSSGVEHCLSPRPCDSRCTVHRDTHTSSDDAAIKLSSAYQKINALPQSDDKQLMMDVYGKLRFVHLILT